MKRRPTPDEHSTDDTESIGGRISTPPLQEAAGSAESPESLDTAVEVGTELRARFRYRVERRLGSGSFGSVFLARRIATSRDDPDTPPDEVAIKVLGSMEDAQALISLKRELAALRRIHHDRIPRLYDWCTDGPVAFVVLEYFPAGSLADTRAFVGQLDVDQTWRLITDMLNALSAAHRAGILHLDVKPSNVLLDGDAGYVLTDFGVSHSSRMSKGLLHQGQIAVGLGTHGYRAPEQADRRIHSFDLRTDLWGVGATAWAMYTGIDLNQRRDVLRRVEDGCIYGLPRLSDVHLGCPPPLEEVIMGLLYIEPTRRPGGAAEVLAQIRAVASGYGMGSRSVTAAQRHDIDDAEIFAMIDSIVDPLWGSICRAPGFERGLAKFEDDEVIAGVGEQAHHTHLLLVGKIEIEKAGVVVDTEEGEGVFVGAISTLAGAPRRATLRARGTVWTCIFNEAELEQFVTCNPSVAVRILRSMAARIADGPARSSD